MFFGPCFLFLKKNEKKTRNNFVCMFFYKLFFSVLIVPKFVGLPNIRWGCICFLAKFYLISSPTLSPIISSSSSSIKPSKSPSSKSSSESKYISSSYGSLGRRAKRGSGGNTRPFRELCAGGGGRT